MSESQETRQPVYPIYPGVGLVAPIVGTLTAVALVPADPNPADALFWPAVAMTAGLLTAPGVACWRSLRAAFRVEHLLMFGLVYWLLLDLLQEAYPLEFVDPDAIVVSFVAIGLFATGIWCASLMRPWPLPRFLVTSVRYPFSTDALFAILLGAFVLGIFKYAYACDFNPVLMLHSVGQDRWSAPWGRDSLGGWHSFLDHLGYFGYLVPALTVLVASRRGWTCPQAIVGCMLSGTIVLFLAQSGSRRIVGVVLGSCLLTWLLLPGWVIGRRVWIGVAATGVLLAFMQFMLYYRGVGMVQVFHDRDAAARPGVGHLHVDDNFLRLAQIIHCVPDSHPYVYHKQILYVLVRPIPRVFWPDKPIDPGFDLPTVLGVKGVSLSSSVVGEWYLTMGLLAVFAGGFLHGGLAGACSRILTMNAGGVGVFVYSISALALFAGLRSMQEIVLMGYTVLAWVVMAHCFAARRAAPPGWSGAGPAHIGRAHE